MASLQAREQGCSAICGLKVDDEISVRI